MLDVGMLVYAGLVVLAVWRKMCSYWFCGLWLSILNYMSLLYALLAGVVVYLLVGFYMAAQDHLDASDIQQAHDVWKVRWLKPFVLISPLAVCATLALNWLLTESHLFEIHKKRAMDKHDRAVQIIALPAVFGAMSLASMLPIFELVTGRINSDMLLSPWYDFKHPLMAHDTGLGPAAGAKSAGAWKEAQELAFWRYETCFYVADLFEAWILYQFGRLVLEQVSESIAGQEGYANLIDGNGGDSEDPPVGSLSKVESDLRDSHRAVAILTWIGTSVFVMLCVAQSACSLWPYIGGKRHAQESIMFHLQIAGFVASCIAIYNLVVVERAFHRHLADVWPMSKFFTVKVLVTLGFIQRSILGALQELDKSLPQLSAKIEALVPFLGDIMRFTDVQTHFFYPALIIFECLLLAIVHLFVWRSDEMWYRAHQDDEHAPLLPKAQEEGKYNDAAARQEAKKEPAAA
uniref:Uncharacterized protein n=1 Tax=Zooxanthella nutricula TaxID=1333877 RepID=A0A6V0CAR2_9DINO